jgi:transposase
MQSALSAAPAVETTGAALSALESENAKLREQLESRDRRIRLLEEALRVLKASHFGASREKLTEAVGQGGLFNEAEVLAELSELGGTEIPLSATPLREMKHASTEKAGRRALASHLPRVNVIHDVPEAERTCACGTALTEIGAEVCEQLDYQPAKVQVLRHIRKKYACRGCERCVKTAALPPQILPRTNAAAGLLAHLVTAKYVDALPLYRQEVIFARHGVKLPRATQAAWVIALTEVVQPLLNLLDERLRASGYIRMDETRIQVLNSHKSPGSDHWMWVRVAGDGGQRIVLFDHDAGRGASAAEQLLQGASGYLQTDGYGVYDGVAARLGLSHAGCLAHCRRKFIEAVKALPAPQQKIPTAAHEAVHRIDALYAIERQAKVLSVAERKALREQKSRPLIERLLSWATPMHSETLGSGKLGQAFDYLLTQWPKLIRYLEDGRLAIDTHAAENAIRPFALGRANWLFADTVNGAKASAALYSLISTAKANQLEPYGYLRRLFDQIPAARSVEEFERLLPFKCSVDTS